MSGFTDILSSVLDRGARLIDWPRQDGLELLQGLTVELLSSKGEASGIALASAIFDGYAELHPDDRLAFFEYLGTQHDPDPEAVSEAAARFATVGDASALAALQTAAEPPRQELFRRLNMAPGGTARLVAMRTDLLGFMRDHPDLRRIDVDFSHLLASWFNRGFLILRPIDWTTPAMILEKIIEYEAVHQIDSWDELRRRVNPQDRRCMAFFHPSMPDEPLIFVEIALMRTVPTSIGQVLDPDRPQIQEEEATTAVFYSISNCQAGLAGVSFGAFLIKQVARDLGRALPRLDTFVTLSPVPGFHRWLQTKSEDPGAVDLIERLASEDPAQAIADQEAAVMRLAAEYFLDAKRADGQPPDPVARFHLGNGAELDAIRWMGDPSEKGLGAAAGLMVNYRYRLDRIETNHEAYVGQGSIVAARAVRNLLRN
ncbi:MAG: malonyl-CoA decarboxylase [Pseudomonadota bacterium]